jgi:alanine racemase
VVTVRLTVYRASWRAQLAQAVAARPGLIPVVKGNGYGFGRDTLMPLVAEIAGTVGVGTVHEVDSVPDDLAPLVLTPARTPPDRRDAILTVASADHVRAIAGWPGRVVIKLMSSMRRYGCRPDEIDALGELVDRSGLELVGYSIHLPLAGTDNDRRAEIDGWLDVLPAGVSLSVSHLSADAYQALRADRPDIEWRIRSGTALWHADKRTVALAADVLQTRPAVAGEHAGYHATEIPFDGTLVMIGAGSAHGVGALPDGRSPFHFARRRLLLLEPPHMHTSVVVVPDDGAPVPGHGDWVDVQRPLIATMVDEIEWH